MLCALLIHLIYSVIFQIWREYYEKERNGEVVSWFNKGKFIIDIFTIFWLNDFLKVMRKFKDKLNRDSHMFSAEWCKAQLILFCSSEWSFLIVMFPCMYRWWDRTAIGIRGDVQDRGKALHSQHYSLSLVKIYISCKMWCLYLTQYCFFHFCNIHSGKFSVEDLCVWGKRVGFKIQRGLKYFYIVTFYMSELFEFFEMRVHIKSIFCPLLKKKMII